MAVTSTPHAEDPNASQEVKLDPTVEMAFEDALEFYVSDRSKKSKEAAAFDFATTILREPENLIEVFSTIQARVSDAPNEEQASAISELYHKTIKAVRRSIKKMPESKYDVLQPRVTDFFDIAVEGSYKELAESVLGGIFDREASVEFGEGAVMCAYVLARHSLLSENIEAVRYASDILTFRTSVAQAGGPLEIALLTARLDAVDDDNFYMGVGISNFVTDTSYYFSGEPYQSKVPNKNITGRIVSKIKHYQHKPSIHNTFKTTAFYANRLNALKTFYSPKDRNGSTTSSGIVPIGAVNSYPANALIPREPNSLTELTQRFSMEYLPNDLKEMGAIPIAPPGGPEMLLTLAGSMTLEELKQSVKDAYLERVNKKHFVVTEALQVRTFLDYVVPSDVANKRIQGKDYDEIFEVVKEARHNIVELPTKGLPSRPLQVVISPDFDADLSELGVNAITFSRSSNSALSVEIAIGKSVVRFGLNSDKFLCDQGTGRYLGRKPVRADALCVSWWESKVLKALESYACQPIKDTDRHDRKIESIHDDPLARVGHLRRLGEGEKPGAEQYTLAYEEQGWLLHRINEARVSRGLPLTTYVREVKETEEKRTDTPIKFYPKTGITSLI